MSDKPTRRDLMKPVQLLGLALVAALFAGFVTLFSMGFFQSRFAGQGERALTVALVVTGITFMVVLVVVALLLLAVDPSEIRRQIDRPVLVRDAEEPASGPPASGAGTTDSTDAASRADRDASRPGD